MASDPLGSESNPIFTDTVPVSGGTAIVIATAGAAIALLQAVTTTWRRLSLAKGRSILLARLPLLLAVLALTSAIACVGAFVILRDDARAFGGLLPPLGLLSPFAFLAGRPHDNPSLARRPSRARVLTWALATPLNFVTLLPGLLAAAAAAWAMARAQAWDVLALAFSLAVAVLARVDPLVYYAWDGVGPRWQWGRLLPSPVRMPGWRLVIGRVERDASQYEDDEGDVVVDFDAMEIPFSDNLASHGELAGEDDALSDRALANAIESRGVFKSLPLLYDYIDSVWTEIIHDVRKGDAREGTLLDEAAASCVFLVLTLLKEALEQGGLVGADTWLLLAIVIFRLEKISIEFIQLQELRQRPFSVRVRDQVWLALGAILGREKRGHYEAAVTAEDETKDEEGSGPEPSLATENGAAEEDADGRSNDGSAVPPAGVGGVGETSGACTTEESNEVDVNLSRNGRGRYRLRYLRMFDNVSSPPDSSDTAVWTEWTLNVMNDMYRTALKISRDGPSTVGQKQVESMPDSLSEWLGADVTNELRDILSKTLSSDIIILDSQLIDATEEGISTYAEEAVVKVAEEEAWYYVMLAMASKFRSRAAVDGPAVMVFEGAGVSSSAGEMNGRLEAQNMARKLLAGQVALWSYVAVGQTARALLSYA